jgi:putative thioredoxin
MPPSMNLHGAVDLSAVKARAEAAARPAAEREAPASSPYIVQVTEQTFPQLVQLSAQVPVIVDLSASWSEQSAQVSAVLEAAAIEFDGRFLLAQADLQAQPQIAQAFQAQAAPTVVAVVKGQPVPLFEGALPAEQIRAFLDELLKVAEANGVTGTLNEGAAAAAPAAAAEPELPPLHQEAFDAIEAGNFAEAAAAYRRALAEQPADADAKAGLAQVELMQRLENTDAAQVRAAGAERPDDVQAQLAVADLDLSGGHVEDAFARVTSFIARSGGEDKETARKRLLELFEIVGPTDPRVTKARAALARALF